MDNNTKFFQLNGYLQRLQYFNEDCLSVSVKNSINDLKDYRLSTFEMLKADHYHLCNEYKELIKHCPEVQENFIIQ